MARWASGGIILSSVVTRYQLGLVLHAGSLIAPLMAPMPHGTWESAINAAFSGSTSAAKAAGNFALSRNKKPSCGGSIGGTGAPGGGSLISDPTDSPRKLAVRLYWMWRKGWDHQQMVQFGSHVGQPVVSHGVK